MLLTTVLLTVLGQAPLPGSGLSLEQAKVEARFIVVAEVGKTGDRITAPHMSCYMWTELKPSAALKGKVTGEELNRNPLSLLARGEERLPRTGDELLFFVGDTRREFVITKVLPKTEANLAAIRSKTPPLAKPEPGASGHGLSPFSSPSGGIGGGFAGGGLGGGGLGGGGLDNGVLAEPEPESRPYRGTKIVPNPEATGEALKLQEKFAAAMARADPVPEGRRAHFAWLDENEYVRRFRMTRMGWYGGIKSVEPRPGGGWVVRIVIRPWLYIPFRGTMPDNVEETYDYVGGRLHMTQSDAADAKPNLQRFYRF